MAAPRMAAEAERVEMRLLASLPGRRRPKIIGRPNKEGAGKRTVIVMERRRGGKRTFQEDASSDNDCRKVRLRGIGLKPPNAQPVENTAADFPALDLLYFFRGDGLASPKQKRSRSADWADLALPSNFPCRPADPWRPTKLLKHLPGPLYLGANLLLSHLVTMTLGAKGPASSPSRKPKQTLKQAKAVASAQGSAGQSNTADGINSFLELALSKGCETGPDSCAESEMVSTKVGGPHDSAEESSARPLREFDQISELFVCHSNPMCGLSDEDLTEDEEDRLPEYAVNSTVFQEPIVRTAKQKPVLAASAFTPDVYAQKDALPSQKQAAPERAQDLIKDFLSRTSMYAGPSARDASAESAQIREPPVEQPTSPVEDVSPPKGEASPQIQLPLEESAPPVPDASTASYGTPSKMQPPSMIGSNPTTDVMINFAFGLEEMLETACQQGAAPVALHCAGQQILAAFWSRHSEHAHSRASSSTPSPAAAPSAQKAPAQVDDNSVKVDFVSPAADTVRAWQAAPRFAPEESPERERQLDRATSLSDWVATATLDETEPAPVHDAPREAAVSPDQVAPEPAGAAPAEAAPSQPDLPASKGVPMAEPPAQAASSQRDTDGTPPAQGHVQDFNMAEDKPPCREDPSAEEPGASIQDPPSEVPPYAPAQRKRSKALPTKGLDKENKRPLSAYPPTPQNRWPKRPLQEICERECRREISNIPPGSLELSTRKTLQQPTASENAASAETDSQREVTSMQLSTGTESSNEASNKPLCKRAREGAALHEDRQVKVARLGAISKEGASVMQLRPKHTTGSCSKRLKPNVQEAVPEQIARHHSVQHSQSASAGCLHFESVEAGLSTSEEPLNLKTAHVDNICSSDGRQSSTGMPEVAPAMSGSLMDQEDSAIALVMCYLGTRALRRFRMTCKRIWNFQPVQALHQLNASQRRPPSIRADAGAAYNDMGHVVPPAAMPGSDTGHLVASVAPANSADAIAAGGSHGDEGSSAGGGRPASAPNSGATDEELAGWKHPSFGFLPETLEGAQILLQKRLTLASTRGTKGTVETDQQRREHSKNPGYFRKHRRSDLYYISDPNDKCDSEITLKARRAARARDSIVKRNGGTEPQRGHGMYKMYRCAKKHAMGLKVFNGRVT